MRTTLSLVICLVILTGVYGQNKSTIYFHIDKQTYKEKVNPPKDAISQIKKRVLTKLYLSGYTGLSIKDSTLKKGNWHYEVQYKSHFKSVELRSDHDQSQTSLSTTLTTINDILTDLENDGYPFAEVKIDAFDEEKEQLVIHYSIDSGQRYIISEIHLKSNDDFNEKTLLNIIDIKQGDLYNESKIKNLNQVIVNNDLYALLRAPELLFRPDKVELFIYFEKKKSSNAEGFIGFQQNAVSQRLELNGYIDFVLKNALNRAEFLQFNWKSNPDKSQNLLIDFRYPYLLNLPLGIAANTNIQKQDTTFLRTAFHGSLQYLTPYYTTGFFAQLDNSFLLNDVILSDFRPFRKNTFGLESTFKYYNLKKYKPTFYFKVGLFNYESDSLESAASTSNLLVELQLNQDYQISGPFFFHSSLNFKQLNASYQTSRNELFYFGGLNTVRGFYELELNGNTVFYALNSIEFKPVSLLSFQLIYDYSQFHSSGFFRTHSFGFGFNLKNNNNALSFIIANGMVNDNPFDLSSTKLHIGLVSNF